MKQAFSWRTTPVKTRIDASDIDEAEDRVIVDHLRKTAKFQNTNVKLWLTMKQTYNCWFTF